MANVDQTSSANIKVILPRSQLLAEAEKDILGLAYVNAYGLKMKLYSLLLVSILTAIGCSSSNNISSLDDVGSAGSENETPDDVAIAQFIGTWQGCRDDPNALGEHVIFTYIGPPDFNIVGL